MFHVELCMWLEILNDSFDLNINGGQNLLSLVVCSRVRAGWSGHTRARARLGHGYDGYSGNTDRVSRIFFFKNRALPVLYLCPLYPWGAGRSGKGWSGPVCFFCFFFLTMSYKFYYVFIIRLLKIKTFWQTAKYLAGSIRKWTAR